MAAQPEGPFELAMTQRADGRSVGRPASVVAYAHRVAAWKDSPNVCQSCTHEMARYLRQGMALCPSCRDNRALREGGFEYSSRRVSVDERDDSVAGNGLEGLAIVFDRWSVDLGGFRERIRPVAIDRTIAEGIDLVTLWNHNTDLPLARMSANTMTVRKKADGLWVRSLMPDTADSQFEAVDRRTVQGQSFGFRVVDDEWNFDGPMPLRDVLDMRVSETSFVTFPAYPDTTARAVRAVTLSGRSQRWADTRLRLAR